MHEWIAMDDSPPSDEDDWATKPCAAGVGSHRWRLVIHDGARGLQSDCEACTDFVNEMLAEVSYVEADIPVTLTWESCNNPGGWHGLDRCDCGAYWIVTPDREER